MGSVRQTNAIKVKCLNQGLTPVNKQLNWLGLSRCGGYFCRVLFVREDDGVEDGGG